MPKPNKSPDKKKTNLQKHLGVAIVFLVAGVALIIPENTRATGLPLLVLGFTFFVLSQQNTKDKDSL